MTPTQAIQQIKADKNARKVFPTYATRTELIALGCKVEDIREAVKNGELRFGRTINDFYFEII
jgi:hypothetical protein